MEQATPLSMTKRMRAKAAMKISVPVCAPNRSSGAPDEKNAADKKSIADSPPVTPPLRSEEHTSELQSLMRISYAVFCLKKKIKTSIKNCNNINISPNIQE